MANNFGRYGFEVVLPTEDTMRLIMAWRNDPETLEMSFHHQPKTFHQFHGEFLNRYFRVRLLPSLFFLKDGERVAVLFFSEIIHPENLRRRCCEISINVAPMYRAKGIGTICLTMVQNWVLNQGFDDIYAEVRKENIASQKAFERAGFEKLSDFLKVIEDINEPIPICRYLARLSPIKKAHPVFIIAEAGSNWRMGTPAKDMAMARKMIESAVEAGANAVKFQIFRPETVYVPNAGQSDYLAEAGIQEEIREIFSDMAMPYEMIPDLASYCEDCGVEFMGSFFSSVDFAAVDPFVTRHKIASYEIGHLRLIELAAKSGKPLVLSTGAAFEEEIAWAVDTFYQLGGTSLTLLQCTAKYPAVPNTMNLNAIPWLKERFKVDTGLSDHSRHPLDAPIAAVALGATIIEKHFTISNALPGPDHAFAVTPSEFKQMVEAIRQTELMLGPGVKVVYDSEQELRDYARRGIQAVRNIFKGEIFQEGVNVEILRPGKQPIGLHPKHIVEIEGKKALRDIAMGTGIQKGDF